MFWLMIVQGRKIFCNLAAVRDSSKSSASASSGAGAGVGAGATHVGQYGAPAGPGGDDDVDSRKLFVRGLAYDVTADRLRSLFEEYGDVEDCSVITDKSTGKLGTTGRQQRRHPFIRNCDE